MRHSLWIFWGHSHGKASLSAHRAASRVELAPTDDFVWFLATGRILNAVSRGDGECIPSDMPEGDIHKMLSLKVGLTDLALRYVESLKKRFGDEFYFRPFARLLSEQPDPVEVGNGCCRRSDEPFALISYDKSVRASVQELDLAGDILLSKRLVTMGPGKLYHSLELAERRSFYDELHAEVEILLGAFRLAADLFLDGLAEELQLEKAHRNRHAAAA